VSTTIGSYPTSKDSLADLRRREEIISVVKRRYIEVFNKNVPIYGIDKANLRDFTTTEKDAKKGLSKFPPMNVLL